MAPTGRVTVHLSSTELQAARRVALEVVGSGESASVNLSCESRPVCDFITLTGKIRAETCIGAHDLCSSC